MPLSPHLKVAKDARRHSEALNEVKIAAALHDIESGSCKSVRAAAKLHGVSQATLYRRKKGGKTRVEAHSQQQNLTPEQEKVLVTKIERMAHYGFPVTPAELRQYANRFLAVNTSNSNAQVSQWWPSYFMSRHPNLKNKCSRSLNRSTTQAVRPDVIVEYTKLVQQTIQQYNITSDHIYNMDETGFQLATTACTNSQNMVLPRKQKTSFRTQPASRESITVVECIGTSGSILPPMVIFKTNHHLIGWLQDLTLPKEWKLVTSDNDWTDSTLSLTWLQHFETVSKPTSQPTYRLLLLDGHTSHVPPEFIDYAWEHNIIPLCFPPHSNHLLQPLAMNILEPLTSVWRQEVDELGKHGVTINEPLFIKTYHQARLKVITSEAAKRSFQDVGFEFNGTTIINPAKILERLSSDYRESTPINLTESSSSSIDDDQNITTPKTSREALVLENMIAQGLGTNEFPHLVLRKLVKATTQAFDRRLFLEEEHRELLHALQKEEQKQPD